MAARREEGSAVNSNQVFAATIDPMVPDATIEQIFLILEQIIASR